MVRRFIGLLGASISWEHLLVCWFVGLLVCELVLFGGLGLLGFGVLGVSLVHFWELWGCFGFILVSF